MKKVLVRVAVAIDRDGAWNACGWAGASRDEMMSTACDTVGSGEARYWLTAGLEIPESREVEAEVERA